MPMAMDDYEDDDPPAPKTAAIGADGIATINISGTLVGKSSGMNALSGLTSYADIAAQFTAAMENPMVRGILEYYDTPGGEVQGMFECAATMAQARGKKPVCAVVNCAASAGYMLAATADAIVVSQTAITGSIGIIALHLDQSGADEKAGLKYTAIFAGDRKNDGNPHEPLSPEARGEIKGRIDKIYGLFVTGVAKNRGMKEVAIRNTQAAVYMGQDGVDAGLADAVGTMDDAAAMLRAAIQQGAKSLSATNFLTSFAASAANKGAVQPMAETTPVQAEAKVPTSAEIEAMVNKASANVRADASLIASMCQMQGKPELVAEFLTAGKTPAQVGAELLALKVAGEKGTELLTGVLPGGKQGAKGDKPDETLGTAKPWGEIMTALGFKKGGK
jgi:signal peptide peptidase SppA